jgi:hypothetical protein
MQYNMFNYSIFFELHDVILRIYQLDLCILLYDPGIRIQYSYFILLFNTMQQLELDMIPLTYLIIH